MKVEQVLKLKEMHKYQYYLPLRDQSRYMEIALEIKGIVTFKVRVNQDRNRREIP